MISILAIGTEITTGQILNKNAQWLSQELLNLGLKANIHIAVPDDETLIEAALHFLEKNSSVILITGGLGPTADDFTRRVLARVHGRPLVWNEENWQKVESKLKSIGVPIRVVHRQQCEYPENCEILSNSAGIADGFTYEIKNKEDEESKVGKDNKEAKNIQIFAMPGPPKELAALWVDHIRNRLSSLAAEPLRWMQLQWTTTGVPESEVASCVNNALGDYAKEVLYRVHSPCVDVKLLFQKKDSELYEQLGLKIKEALAPWLQNGVQVNEGM